MRRAGAWLMAGCGAAALVGCAQPAMDVLTPPVPAVVWPKPPDEPRVRYLGQLTSSSDVRPAKTLSEFWDEVLYGPKEPEPLVSPHAVAVHAVNGQVAVADSNIGCVHLFDLAGHRYRRVAEAPSAEEQTACPAGVAWVGDELWVADARRQAVVIVDPSGGQRLIGTDALQRPAGIACDPSGQACYVSDAKAHRIVLFGRAGNVVRQFGSQGAGPGQMNYPSQIACGPDGTVVVADSLNFRVQRFAPDGTPLGSFGQKGDAPGDLALPKGVAVGPDGVIWVVDGHFENVQAFTPEGQLLMVFGHEGHGPGEFWIPAGLCVDGQRRMWVADAHNHRVQVFELLS